MEGGALAIAVLIIAGFIVFILWAKTATGKTSLRNTLGDPGGAKTRLKSPKRRSHTPQKDVKTNKPPSR